MNSNIIEIENLSKTYKVGFWGRPHQALQNLDLEVSSGSIFGFLGANGAGKTTTIKLLLGLQLPNSGVVRIDNSSIKNRNTRSKIGYLPERPILHADLTGNEFLDFHRNLFGSTIDRKNLKSNAELLELVGVPEVGDRLLREFSKGMLQRVGIAQALVNDPKLVVLDEPMSGLDPVGRRDIRNLIYNLKENGKTVFFSSHIISDVESLCDEIAFLEKGKLKAKGPISDILSDNKDRGTEILFHSLSNEALERLRENFQIHSFGHKYKTEIKEEKKIRETLQFIWESGGTVERLAKVTISLEQALFNTKADE